MEKPFLLLAGSNYYPEAGTGDWQGRYATREEAQARIKEIKHELLFTKGLRAGQVRQVYYSYLLDDQQVDWYLIIDLNE